MCAYAWSRRRGFRTFFASSAPLRGEKPTRPPPLNEANSLLKQYDLDDSEILTWDPSSSTKPTLQQDETAKMQTVHDDLKRLLGKPPYIMLRTHDIDAPAWTAGLAGTLNARYRCARLAMMVVRYATDRDLRPCGTLAHKELMQAARRLLAART